MTKHLFRKEKILYIDGDNSGTLIRFYSEECGIASASLECPVSETIHESDLPAVLYPDGCGYAINFKDTEIGLIVYIAKPAVIQNHGYTKAQLRNNRDELRSFVTFTTAKLILLLPLALETLNAMKEVYTLQRNTALDQPRPLPPAAARP